MKTHKSPSAFTLVEILIVLCIISLLAAIAIPNFIRSQERTRGYEAVTKMFDGATIVRSEVDESNKPRKAVITFRMFGEPVPKPTPPPNEHVAVVIDGVIQSIDGKPVVK